MKRIANRALVVAAAVVLPGVASFIFTEKTAMANPAKKYCTYNIVTSACSAYKAGSAYSATNSECAANSDCLGSGGQPVTVVVKDSDGVTNCAITLLFVGCQ